MYTHLVHTSMSILNCPILPGRDGSQVPVCTYVYTSHYYYRLYSICIFCFQRWYIDGSVKCFNDKHAPLGLLAIFILFLCIAIIPLSLAYITAKLRVSKSLCRLIYKELLTNSIILSVFCSIHGYFVVHLNHW